MSLVFESGAGTVTIPESTLVQIAVGAAESVDGVRVRRKRDVDIEARSVRLDLTVAAGGNPLIAVGASVQTAVAGALRRMCGLDLTVDVAIEELA